MIIDCNASCGSWPSSPFPATSPAEAREALTAYGVERIYLASLDSAWCRNPLLPNARLLADTETLRDVSPVPTLDPTVHTWRDHLAEVGRTGRVRMVRLLPQYGPYNLAETDEMLDELRQLGMVVQIQTRLDDPRRHHPLAQVPDFPAADIVKAARRHPSLAIVIGGARFGELRALAGEILEHNLLYADTSQCDGMDALAVLCEEGLRDRLLYGSHFPLFEIIAGLRRVVDDLDEDTAAGILGGNAKGIL